MPARLRADGNTGPLGTLVSSSWCVRSLIQHGFIIGFEELQAGSGFENIMVCVRVRTRVSVSVCVSVCACALGGSGVWVCWGGEQTRR